ncbi:MAG: FAD-dependent oxidoreductase [Rhodobacter sp.]|nr:FAD-dependent oxidoreductase [Rhodobacter sp.]
MASVEVTVRGAGIFGLSVAWACARRGARVRVVDPFGAGVGASGGVMGALAPHVPEAWNALKAFQLDSLLMAEGWWQAVRAAGGVDPGYARLGRMQPLADAAAVEAARGRARRVPRRIGRMRRSGAWSRLGGAVEPLSPSGWVVRDTLSARLSPRRAGSALVAALRALAGDVVSEAPDAGAVIHATGAAGLAELSAALGRKVGSGVKGQAAVLRHDARNEAQVYAGGLHLVPHADGTVAVGSTSESDWTVDGPDAQVEDLIARAQAVMPCLAGAEVLERWAGVRPRSVTRQLLLGEWPGRKGHFLANGGFKIGFGMAPKMAEVMAELVLEGRDSLPDAFRLTGLP